MIDYHTSHGLCVLRLSSPPLNTIDFGLLEQLQAAIARAGADAGVEGIVLTGDAAHFSAGADLGLFRQIACADDAIHVSRVFQRAFQAVEDSPKPVVAAVAGRVIAGALELALACHYRVAHRDARFSMQEITLGINPGAGGTQRLPRLVGLEKALKMLLTAQTIAAQEALECGLVDAICDDQPLVDSARELLRRAPPPQKTSERTDRLGDGTSRRAAFHEAEKLAADMRPEIIAPRKIIAAVRAGVEQSVQAGLALEQAGFAECMGTAAAQNKIYLFFATREAGKVRGVGSGRKAAGSGERGKWQGASGRSSLPTADSPLPFSRSLLFSAAVVGMGTMGTGIAQALITAGIPTIVCDRDSSALQRGSERIRRSLQKRGAQGKCSGQREVAQASSLSAADTGKMPVPQPDPTLGLLTTTTHWEELAHADVVFEAVFEDVEAKRAALAEIERVCRPDAVIASNTSTISLDVLAQPLRHPERLVGMHFFNPAQRMPLVEIVRREGTHPDVLAAALDVAKRLRKTPVVVANRVGFLVNRLFIPYFKEAFWLLEEGADPPAVDRAMVEFGFPMGPLTLIDMAGLDVLALTDGVLRQAFPRHGPMPQVLSRLVEGGHLGQKCGSGVYKYQKGDYTPHPNPAAEQILAEVRSQRDRGAAEMPGDQIAERLVLCMVNEAFYVIEDGVAQRESDLDVAMVLGTGFPDFRGGVLRYAYDLGLERVLARLDALSQTCGERYSPSRLLRQRTGA